MARRNRVWLRVACLLGVIGGLCVPSACANLLGIDDAECGSKFPDCASSSADSGTADAGPNGLCDEYCHAITANCTGDNLQYPDIGFCMNVCKTLPPGSPGDSTGNTVQCRLKRAKQTFEPAGVCQVAGPSGGGVCGTLCESYCSTMLAVCNEFTTRTACLDECNSLTDLGTYNTTVQSGTSQQCRLYHVNAAATDADTHCKHAAGDSPCN